MAQNRVEAPPEDQHKLATPPKEGRLAPMATRPYIWLQIAVGGAIALVVGLGTLQLIPLLAHPMALLILAISIAAALAPSVTSLERWLPRILAVIVVYVLVFAFFVIVIQLTIPSLAVQFQKIVGRLPEAAAEIQSRLGGLGVESSTLVNALTPQLGQLSSAIVSLPLTLLSSILEIFLVLVMSIYWLIVAFPLRGFFLSLFPPEGHERLQSLMSNTARAMGGYIRATVINGFTIGFLTYVGLALIGVDFPLVLGVVAGLCELIPIVGPMISGVIVVIAALANSPTQALLALIFMFLLQQFEGNILVPFAMRSQTEISPLLVIIALFAGGTIGGLLGALVAIPVVAALQVLVVELVVPEVRRWLGASEAR